MKYISCPMPEDISCGEIEAIICNGLFLYTPP